VHDNPDAVHDQLFMAVDLLRMAATQLKMLDPETGEEALVELVAAQVANLEELQGLLESKDTHRPRVLQ
jgi:uncharacterized protein YutE (UPF0331/DUF86 family)